jgi:hypothetical protein
MGNQMDSNLFREVHARVKAAKDRALTTKKEATEARQKKEELERLAIAEAEGN